MKLRMLKGESNVDGFEGSLLLELESKERLNCKHRTCCFWFIILAPSVCVLMRTTFSIEEARKSTFRPGVKIKRMSFMIEMAR
jgi:hypothetical protein